MTQEIQLPPPDPPPPVSTIAGVSLATLYGLCWIWLFESRKGWDSIAVAMVLLYSFLPVAILSAALVWIGSLRGEKAPGSAFRYSIVAVVAASIAYWPFSPYASEVAKEQRMERHWDEERRTWGETGNIDTFAVQPDRKILVGGFGLARLMPDGAIDSGFHCKLRQRFTQTGDGPRRIHVLADGRILVSGPRLLIRLDADGRSDQTFHPTEPPADPVQFAVLLPHGHVVLHAGSGVELKRYTSNGTLESRSNSLLPDSDGRGMVTAIQADSSGTIFVSGLFALAGRPGVYGLVRLQADGALDAEYPPVRVKSPLVIQEVRRGYNPPGTRLTIRQSDGRSRQWVVARAEIEPQPATNPDRVHTAWQAPDGKLLALQNRRLWRLKEDGLPDPAFVVAKLQTEP